MFTHPMVVAYGMGVDSTAVLVGLAKRGERPDLILFADTGSEKPETYAYLPTINAWLESVGFPLVTVVKNPRPKSGDKSLGEACHRNGVLPSLAYNGHTCSLVWKRDPQVAFVKKWQPAIDAWKRGELVTQLIGYDAGTRDRKRCEKSYGKATPGFQNRYPLIEWGWDRERCEQEILAAGLPVPVKSACWFCPASKRSEVEWLAAFHPELAREAIDMERHAIEGGFKRKGLGISWSWAEHLDAQASKLLVSTDQTQEAA